jgi:hypothetical protein
VDIHRLRRIRRGRTGEVAPDFGSFGGDYLPAAGVGARFVMSQKHRVSLSFDVAQGKDGAEYYFGVGEAF